MKHVSILLRLVVSLGIIAYTAPARSGCTSGTQTNVKNFPSSSVSVSRNATVGTVINEATNVTGDFSPGVTCTPSHLAHWMMLRYGNTMTLVTGAGIPAGVYKTNIAGIGIQIEETLFSNFILTDNLQHWYQQTNLSGGGHYITGLTMKLIITGPVSPGTIHFPEPFVESWMGTSTASTTDAANYAVLNMSDVNITVKSCETPDITVNLGEHHRSDFSGINSTSPAKQFNFEIKNCDPGLNSVNYTFKPVTALQQSGTANQYITLDASSTASGVGIQVLYNDGTIVPFNSKVKYTGYSKTAGGSYVIPMKARYIQTAGTIGGGTANSAVEFMMSYE